MADPKGNIPLNMDPSQEQSKQVGGEAPVVKAKTQKERKFYFKLD
jgi:hypothetical protein